MLQGVRVLDLSRVLAGPLATMILGDLGADVVKVEPPKGDETRQWAPFVDGESAYFMSINRNKRSIAIDLKKPEGREVFYRLVEKSDVVVENFRPGVPEALGVDYNTLKKIRSDIVYCSIKGFSVDSPYATKPAYDLILQGMSGLMATTGEEGRPPVRVSFALFDIITGLIAATTIIAALYRRKETGQGAYIEVPLYDSSIFGMSYIAMIYLLTGREPRRMGSAHPSIVPYQAFKCRDGKYLVVAAANDRFWKRLCSALRLGEVCEDPRFATNPERVKNRDVLIPILEKKFQEKPRDEWLEILEAAGVPCGPVYALSEVFQDAYVKASGLIDDVVHESLGRVKQILYPAIIQGRRAEIKLPPPLLGAHAKDILLEAGYSEEEVEKLVEEGVVCCKK